MAGAGSRQADLKTAAALKTKAPAARASRSIGASAHSQGIVDKMGAYLAHHAQVGIQTLQNLFATWLTSLMTWLVIGIALAMPAILFILLANMGSFGGDWDGKPRISLYLVKEISDDEALSFSRELASDNQIAGVRYITASSALLEFTSQTGFGDVLASLPSNPLPAVIEIEPSALSPGEIKIKVLQLEARVEVDSVSVDLEWIERLFALLSLLQRFVTSLAMLLGMGVLLAIGNTIRLAIENRRAEIEVVKLVGGTDRFVRRPFLYLGFWYGLGGGVMAWLMVHASLMFLSTPIERLMHAYQGEFVISGLGLGESLILLGSGALLGVLGAALAVSRHLRQIEPG